MSSRTEEINAGGRAVTIVRGASSVTVDGITYYDTGRTFGGHSYFRREAAGAQMKARFHPYESKPRRLFTRTGTITWRQHYPAGSLEALVCEAEGREPTCSVTYGPAAGVIVPS
jgi:hypothetical protein